MPLKPASQRLFLALWPDEPLRQALAGFIEPLVPPSTGRPVPARNLHVTLAFLGNVITERLAVVHEVVGNAVPPFVPLAFDRVAHWPKARLLCLEASTLPEAFRESVVQLHHELRQAGFSLDERPFRAHITFVRNVNLPAGSTYTREIPPFRWPVAGMALVASKQERGGSEYRVLMHWK